MKKKLTLSIDDRISARAKRFARQQGTSVSDLVETYLAEIASKGGEQWEPPTGSVTASLLAAAKDASKIGVDYKAEKEGVSMNQLISLAVAEKLSSLLTVDYLHERANKANPEDFKKLLDKVPDAEPEPYDKL